MTNNQSSPSPAVSTSLQAVQRRAEAASLDCELILERGDEDLSDEAYLRLRFPNGRGERRRLIDESRADALIGTAFENVIFLGDYEAIADRATGHIEVSIANASPGASIYNVPRFWQLPGAEVFDADEQSGKETDGANGIVRRAASPESWRLTATSETTTIEISPPSTLATALLRGPARSTLKIIGAPSRTHDEAVAVLERYGHAFLFDLDVVHGVSARMTRARVPRRRVRVGKSETKPQFPRNHYAHQALDLYQYGRSAAGLPLLEYLAYYQAVEYFFPYFAREQTIHALRATLLNPAFNASEDADLNRLIGLTSTRNFLAERDQLRATMRASISAADLREFVESSEEVREHFCSKKQAIKGVLPIQINGTYPDLREQAADRIYSIRCRIVHAKQDGGGVGDDVLLPSSAEVHSLQADVELMRLVAQRALIARAART
jgi:hypothetical protein